MAAALNGGSDDMESIEQLLALVVCVVCLASAVCFVRNFLVSMGLVTLGLAAWVAAGGMDALRAMLGGG
jgi:hypothetical protein